MAEDAIGYIVTQYAGRGLPPERSDFEDKVKAEKAFTDAKMAAILWQSRPVSSGLGWIKLKEKDAPPPSAAPAPGAKPAVPAAAGAKPAVPAAAAKPAAPGAVPAAAPKPAAPTPPSGATPAAAPKATVAANPVVSAPPPAAAAPTPAADATAPEKKPDAH